MALGEVGGEWRAGVNPVADKDRVDPEPRRAEHVGYRPVADRQNLAERRVAGEAEGVAIDWRMGLAIPGDAPAERFVQVRQCPRTGLALPAVDHFSVGVEAVEQDVVRRPSLEQRRIIAWASALFVEPGAGDLGEVAIAEFEPVGDEVGAVVARAEETDAAPRMG